MAPSTDGPPHARVLVGAVTASVVIVGVVALLGTHHQPLTLPVETGLTGLSGLVGAVLILRRARAEGRRALFRLAGGLAALLYGAGQVVLALEQATSSTTLPFPAVGDLVSLSCGPFAIALVVLLPRPSGTAGRLPRLLPDALVVATAGALLLWRTLFLGASASLSASVAAAAVVLIELLVVALLLQLAVVALDAGPAILGAGVAVLACGDTATSALALHHGHVADWPTSLGSAAAWPLISAGVLLVRGRGTARERSVGAAAEARASMTTVSLLALCAAGVAGTLLDRRVDTVSLALLGLLLTGCTVRELVLQRQRVTQLAALSLAADHDPLTGLANRRALAADLDRLGRGRGSVGVLVIDLDGFKAVNDQLGHSTGDALIVAVSRALRPFAEDGVVARLGGDEFAVVVPQGEEAVMALAEDLVVAVRRCAGDVPGVARVHVSASVGVMMTDAAALAQGADALSVVSAASAAMQQAKRNGRDQVVRFSGAVAREASRRAAVERRLREALDDGSLVAHLQPVVDLATGALVGFEALSRWDDPELGTVSPEEFVAVAERTGLVLALGRTILRQALGSLAATPAERGLRVAVNASPLELRAPGYADVVAQALAAAGLAPARLVIEVTEGVLVADDDPAVQALHALRASGVGISIDDFGTGWSSLAYLTRFPLSELKIDRSLVSAIEEPRTGPVVTAVVRMAQALGIRVVAEGVELERQRAVLAALGVDRGQGWLWSRALAPVDALRLAGGPAGGEPWLAPRDGADRAPAP